MAIPASGPVSLSTLQTEFGGAHPISIDEYYRGGSNVGAVSSTVGIPSSGTISLDDFHGKAAASGGSGFTISVSPASLYASGTGSPATSPATAAPTGQTGSVSYAWTKVSGDTLTLSNASGASTSFQAAVSIGSPLKAATYKCTATDSAAHVTTDTVDVQIEWDNGA